MTRGEKAEKLFREGLNCAQAVFLAFDDVIKLDKNTMLTLSAGFGGGFGRMREVCGTVSAMTAVISHCNASTDPTDREKKAELYKKIQGAMKEFASVNNGTYICKDLLKGAFDGSHIPDERTPEYYEKRPCPKLCHIAADIAAKYVGDEV